jgi:hypothetical protein
MLLDTFTEFVTDHLGADSLAKRLVQPGYAPQTAYHGVTLCALSTNTVDVFVGGPTVTVNSGFCLPAGKEVFIPISSPKEIYVVANPAANTIAVVTLDGAGEGDTFSLNGSDPIAYDAVAADVQTALEDVFGAGNVSVSGDGPYTIEFIGDLAKQDVVLTGTVSAGTISISTTLASAGSVISWLVV